MYPPIPMNFGQAPSRARRLVHSGDTIVSTVRPYLRGFAFVDSAPPNLVVSTGFAVLTPTPKIAPRFLYQWVLSDPFVQALVERMRGTNYPAVAATDIADLTVLLPPLPEQRRIAEVLTSVDEAIQATEAVIEQTKCVKQGLLARLLTRGIGHTKFQRTEIGRIPKDWRIVAVGDVLAAGPENGRSPMAREGGSGVPTFSIAAVREGRVSIERHLKYAPVPPETVSNFLLQRDDVLIVRGNANPNLVGTCGIVESYPDGCIFPDILIRVRPSADLDVHFLVTVWNSPIVRRQILERAKSTNGTYKINQGDVAAVKIPLPPYPEQARLMRPLKDADSSLRLSQEELDRLRSLKRGLLSDLLSGRVRVKVPRA